MKLAPMLASISCHPTGQCSFHVGAMKVDSEDEVFFVFSVSSLM